MARELHPVSDKNPLGAGRPRGVRNSTPTSRQLRKAKENLFKDVEDMLTQEERDYYDLAYSGQVEIDAAIEMQLFIRLLGLYVTKMMAQGVTDQQVFKDFGPIVAQYRGALNDLEAIRQKRADVKRKYKNDESNEGGVSDYSRKSASDRLDDLLRGNTKGKA